MCRQGAKENFVVTSRHVVEEVSASPGLTLTMEVRQCAVHNCLFKKGPNHVSEEMHQRITRNLSNSAFQSVFASVNGGSLPLPLSQESC